MPKQRGIPCAEMWQLSKTNMSIISKLIYDLNILFTIILVFCRCAQASSKVCGSTQDPNRIAKASEYGKYIVKEITLPDTKITIKLQKSILSVILMGVDT